MAERRIRDTGYDVYHRGEWLEIWQWVDPSGEVYEAWIARWRATKATADPPPPEPPDGPPPDGPPATR